MSDIQSPVWSGPLAGVRVLDFTRVLAGPAASLALADLGAEVIKVEPPGGGDDTRGFPPYRGEESHYFLAYNRGKRSIVLDLKRPEGVAVAEALAAKSDIVIENYRPGVMDRLGIGWDRLSAINPALIYCAISGYGQTGPLRDRPSFDLVLQAMAGVISVNGEAGRDPVKLGIPLGDLTGGVNAPIAILGALHERHRTGRGRYIDISLTDGLLNFLGYYAQMAWINGRDPEPWGSQHPTIVPYGSFATSDGSMIIACLTNAFWSRICTALGIADDPSLHALEARRDRREDVNAMIEAVTATMTNADLATLLTAHAVPHAPILGVTEALAQPQTVARDMVVEVAHSSLGPIPIVNRPFKFDEAQAPPAAPPVLGEHGDAILADVLGMDAAEIAALRDKGALG
jgi:formyl-CoA transferase